MTPRATGDFLHFSSSLSASLALPLSLTIPSIPMPVLMCMVNDAAVDSCDVPGPLMGRHGDHICAERLLLYAGCLPWRTHRGLLSPRSTECRWLPGR